MRSQKWRTFRITISTISTDSNQMASARLRETALNSPKLLYKFLLRECQKLPKDAQQYYKHSVKQSFKQHVTEPDSDRVRQIMEKAVQDAEWVLNKYTKVDKGKIPDKR